MESGSLELDADGAYAMRHVQLHECDHTFTPERIEFHETGTFTVERKLLRILFVDVSGPDHRTAGIEGKRIVFLGPEDAERQLFEKAEP